MERQWKSIDDRTDGNDRPNKRNMIINSYDYDDDENGDDDDVVVVVVVVDDDDGNGDCCCC